MSSLNKLLEETKKQNKKALILGAGISGIESALFLYRNGIQSILVEKQKKEDYLSKSKFKDRIKELEEKNIELKFGVEGESLSKDLQDVGVCIISPGISLVSLSANSVRTRDIPIIGEFELGVEASGRICLAVTGSNGKTTTVTLLNHILKHAGLDVILRGNVGTPAVTGIEEIKKTVDINKFIVAEASSYQLETCSIIKPKIGIFLNISENHLERHGTIERYFEAKARLFQNQTKEDLLILNNDDQFARRLKNNRSNIQTFGVSEGVDAKILYDLSKDTDEILLKNNESVILKGVKLLGLHNRYNIAAATLAAISLGIDKKKIEEAIKTFPPLTHRIEVVKDDKDIWINDSKSTTVAATYAALNCVLEEWSKKKIILLIGGLMKAGSWTPVFETIKKHQKRFLSVIAFGQDGSLIREHGESSGVTIEKVKDVQEAVELSKDKLDGNSIVLFSPGCASFDEFSDFEARGEYYKRIV